MEEIQPIAEMEFKPRELFTYLPPVRPVDIEFHNLTYTVSSGRRKGKKDILKGIDGRFQAGELTAILGPSGSGKTSLLNILTGFRTVGAMGSVKTNGTERSLADFKKMSCYILQDDQLHSFLTVDEVMTIAADLKLGNNLTSTEKQLAIKDILDILGLSHCKNTPSGSLSGGQKKRLSIALEMVKNPAIMFLDEPTTGLDSQSCTQCVSMLKTLARGGRTIICTIHSPSASVYEMFDHVYVMAEGNCVYQGSSNNTISFLDYVGLSCPQYHNPADFIIEISCGEYGDHTKSMVALSDNGKSFLWRKNRRKDSPQISSRPKKKSFSKRNSIVNKLFREKFSPDNMAATSEWTQFILLLKRNFVQAHRDWMSTYLRILIHLVVGGVIGLLYTEAGAEGSKTLSNFGYFMVCLTYLMYTAMMPAILKFPSELPILVKEHFNNWYSLRSYYMAFLAVDTPFQIIFCTVYTVMSYFISSQPLDISRFSMFLSITLMVCLVAESIGLILGSVVNIVNGTFLGTILAAPMLLFAGFVIPFADMPSYLSWFSYITYIRYGLEGLTVAIYGYGRETLSCVKRYCHFRYPAKVLKEIGMEQSKYWVDIVVLISILCCLRFVAYWCLRRKIRNVR